MINNRTMSSSFFTSFYPWMIVSFGMLFYCFNYFLRVSPGVMQADLTQTFHITATQFGTLAGLYYMAYTPMQLPAGMIFDKYGVRFVLSVACLVAVIGLSVFISADDFYVASIGRLLIGLGCAFSYIGTLKLAAIWLPPSRFATVAGLATAVGMVSGALSQKYLTHIVEAIGYQDALRGALVMGAILSVSIIFLVRNRPAMTTQAQTEMGNPINFQELRSAVWMIFKNKQMWLIGIIGCLLYLPSSVFLDLWGIPYLKSVYNITQDDAVEISNFTFYGWIISGPIIGIISDKISRRVLPLTFTGFFAAALLCAVFYLPGGVPTSSLTLIFFLIGFCCGAHPLCFALGKESNPIRVSGTAVAITNMLIMLGGMVFQPVVGKLLDMHSSGMIGEDGLPVYSAMDYTYALSIVPIGVALGIFLSFFLRETHCELLDESTSTTESNVEDVIDLEPETEGAQL